MPQPNYHHLEIFYTAARLGSFSEASRALHISQPSVSLQIKALERYFGTPLFDRQARKVRLTEAGQVVLQHAQRIFNLTQDMERAVADLRGVVAGHLVVGASSTPGEYLLPALLGRFRERHPGVEVSLTIANTARIADLLQRHELDLGLVGKQGDWPDLVTQPFRSDRLVVFASPGHPLAHKPAVSPRDLEEQPFVMREVGSATRHTAEECLQALGVPVRASMALGSNEAVKRAVAAGLGLGILSRFALDAELAAGYVRLVNVRGMDCRRQLYILYHRQKHLTRAQAAFLELLHQEAASD